MPVASARPDQNPKEMASQSEPGGPWPTGARWRVLQSTPPPPPHVQLRCCSAYRRASSLEPTRRQRARAEPRARRSLIAPPSTSSTCADRVVVRRVRRPGRTAERRPTSSSRSASLLLCLSPRQLTRANTTTASPRRAASTSFLDRAAVDLVDVRRSCRRAPRAPSRPHRRAPTDVILTFSSVAALPVAAPAHSSQHDDSEPAPSREHVAPISHPSCCCGAPSCAAAWRLLLTTLVVLALRCRSSPIGRPSTNDHRPKGVPCRRGIPTEDRRRTAWLASGEGLMRRRPSRRHRWLAAASPLAPPYGKLCCSAHSAAQPRSPSVRTEAHRPPRQTRASFLDRAAVDLVDVRRSCRRAPRAPSRPHRRAPTDVILTFSFVAALPIAAPAHSSQHDDSEPAPSREHVVP